jgi:AP-1 complex subunit beta-1
VRKTAVLCVSKIYDVNKALVEEQFCFIDTLQKMIEDEGNSMVISNCIASLIEISTSK